MALQSRREISMRNEWQGDTSFVFIFSCKGAEKITQINSKICFEIIITLYQKLNFCMFELTHHCKTYLYPETLPNTMLQFA